jgi:SWI/SNF-related matrix-associated actin-dependent regulator 1 of chromatin subfamily A
VWFPTGANLQNGIKIMRDKPRSLVINYEQLQHVADAALKFDAIIFDECHYLKNRQAIRTKVALTHVWDLAPYHWLLSGTPLPNGRASEAYPYFAKLSPADFGNWKQFAATYCIEETAPWNGWLKLYRKSKNLDQLGRIAREKFMLRRSAAEVLAYLPPLQRQIIPLSMSGSSVRKLAEESQKYIAETLRQIEDGNMQLSESMSTMRRLLGEAKVPYAISFIWELLEETESSKVVVFAHHVNVLCKLKDLLVEKGISHVILGGATSASDRQKAVDEFQNGDAKVFLGSLMAANVGITLTAASCCVMVESDWTPSINEQAEGRIFRIGQKEISRVFYLTVPNSLDDAITMALVKKQRNILKTLNA